VDRITVGRGRPGLVRDTLSRANPKPETADWEFPNTQSWNFAGELSADGTTITGVTSSAQGGVQLEFRKR
jgi:hypothetical protein